MVSSGNGSLTSIVHFTSAQLGDVMIELRLVPGCQGARVPGCQGARVPGCQGAKWQGGRATPPKRRRDVAAAGG
jgi:hypothetical protein